MAIDRAQVAVLVGPFVPDAYSVVLEVFDIGVARYEPQQFMDYGPQVEFLGGQNREAFGQVKAHLMAENAERTYPGTVMLLHARIQYKLQKVKILFHRTENARIMASLNVSPGRSTVEG